MSNRKELRLNTTYTLVFPKTSKRYQTLLKEMQRIVANHISYYSPTKGYHYYRERDTFDKQVFSFVAVEIVNKLEVKGTLTNSTSVNYCCKVPITWLTEHGTKLKLPKMFYLNPTITTQENSNASENDKQAA